MGKKKKDAFQVVKTKVWQKLQVWKGRLFSAGGKEVLIKAVALAIPIYTMGMFKLPGSLCDELHSMVARFWWGGDASKRTLHWQQWGKLCTPKTEGGLGFRDLCVFNQSMLAKQGWRLLTNPDSLASKVLKGKYFPHSDFMQARVGNQPSFVWRSILWGRELLAKGLRWRVGNGSSIRVFHDPWLPRPHSFRTATKATPATTDLMVADLIDASSGSWKLVDNTLWPVDKDLVLKVSLGNFSHEDKRIWHFDKEGVFTVKYGYRVGLDVRRIVSSSGQSGVGGWRRKLWNLQIPNKVNFHLASLA